MPIVPQYQPNVQDRPIFQQGLTARASPDDMGAAIGRGTQAIAAGVERVGDAFAHVKELEDIANAKERDNQLAAWDREAKYGENGFMTLEGKAAVDGRSAYETQLEQKRRELGKDLSPSAQQKYSQASQARVNSSLDQSIIHTANGRKQWFADASTARIDTFAEDALAGFQNPSLVTKNIAAGQSELRSMAELQGWDADTLKNKEKEFISGVRKNVALRIAQTDPIAAKKYADAHNKELTGPHQYDLDGTLKGAVEEAEATGVVANILTGTRTQPGGGDIAPAGVAQAGRTLKDSGPTRTRQFLIERAPGKGASAVDGLDEAFATNLAAMIQDAPPGISEGLQIMSGHRSHARQVELFNNSDKSGRRVARPGHSNHEERADGTAKAVDLMWNGKTLKPGNVPQNVLDWVHANAKSYGMYFPMSWEDWHIEPVGTRGGGGAGSKVVARNGQVAPRSVMPSYQNIEDQLSGITNPRVRDLARKQLYAAIEMQNKASDQAAKAAKAELWNAYVVNGQTPDQVDPAIKLLAGEDAVSGIWSYMKTEAERGKPVDDDVAVYGMRRFAAQDPAAFAEIDLNDYRDRLSPETFKEMTSLQTSALTDERKAREEGMTITTAFSQAQSNLEALGISTVGLDGSKRQAQAAKIAQFNNALSRQMQEFKDREKTNPTQVDIRDMINRLLLPIVVEEEKSMWNLTKTPWSSTSGRAGFLFEAGSVPDGAAVDVVVEYADIPRDMRQGISTRLETELGRKPSEDEVVAEYEAYVLGQ